jgi:outer membrane protein assembly factor BamD
MTTDISRRDVTHLQQAFSDFNELVTRFPASEYARDARQRMVYLRNALAEAEVNVATFYIGRGANVAAANRARHVVENYGQTPAVADALAVLVEANWKLGLQGAAGDALKVLALNFPDYHGFDDDGQLVLRDVIENRQRSWLNMVTFGLLDRPEVPPPLRIPREDGAS